MSDITDSSAPDRQNVVIVGAGPAGLTAAYVLAKRYGVESTILEGDSQVGGISRTVERDGWRFDIGGHRFFTKVKEVEALWHEILPDEDFLLRPRMSRIYYKGKYYDYPLKASNALKNLGLWEAFLCVMSYLWARIHPPKDESTLEGWIVARFGWRLYRHFFKTYNEKLWGVPVNKLPADFAAQRIKNLSLFNAVVNALMPRRNQKKITSLIEEFQYPKYGPGMMWERCTELVEARGCKVMLETRVVGIRHEGGRAVSVIAESEEGGRTEYAADHVVSSMPISKLLQAMDPPASPEVVKAADDLGYRDFLTVALVVPEEYSFPDNWI
jgi:protoporphyrinogen oxidase